MKDRNELLYMVVFGQSDVGLVRENNEDSFLLMDLTGAEKIALADPVHLVGRKGSLFLVADGMGGAEAGEVASRMAVDLVSLHMSKHLRGRKFLSRQAFVRSLIKSIEQANAIIYKESYKNKRHKGMGTTLTGVGVYDGALFFAQVGDSRGYLVRNGSITQMTQDQSLVAHLVASGALSPEEAKIHPQRNVILQALGVQKRVDVKISLVELRRGDWAVLCSDGLSGKVDAEEINGILKGSAGPKEACQQMIDVAKEKGGEDNITVIAAKFDGEKLPLPSPDEAPTYKEFKEEGRSRFWPWRKR